MALTKETKCLFCAFSRVTTRPVRPLAQRSQSASRYFATQPRRSKGDDSTKVDFSQISKVPAAELKSFTQEQQAAIKAAEKVIDTEALQNAGRNVHPWSLDYYDDLAKVDAVVDKPIKAPWTNIDENSRLKNESEISEDFLKLMNNLPDDEDKAVEMWREFDKNFRVTTGREEAERNPRSALAPEIPSFRALEKKNKKASGKRNRDDEAEVSPELRQLMQATGLTKAYISRLRVKTLVMHTVVNQTRLGKIRKQYALCIAGNGNGMIGIGEGKSDEAMTAVIQGQYRAIRDMQPIARYENRTIFGDVKGKVSATELELYTRPPGFGLRCQQYIYEICRAAGITDLAARVTRSRNPMNTVKATIQALKSQKDPEEIARARGKKLVDVRKVYYAGIV